MISVPIGQSLRFRPVNTDPFNFDNTFDRLNPRMYVEFTQYVAGEDIQIQVVTPDDNASFATMYLVIGSVSTAITGAVTTYIGTYKHETFVIPFGSFTGCGAYVEIYFCYEDETPVLSYQSEPFDIETKTDFYKAEWTNDESKYLMDYSGSLVHQMQVEALMKMINHSGEASIYSNQGEDVKLKEIVNRQFHFDAELPDYLCEILTLAMAHDHFYINEVEFVISKKPTYAQRSNSNMFTFVAELKQKTVIGINTHDVGINYTDMAANHQTFTGVSGQLTYTVTDFVMNASAIVRVNKAEQYNTKSGQSFTLFAVSDGDLIEVLNVNTL